MGSSHRLSPERIRFNNTVNSAMRHLANKTREPGLSIFADVNSWRYCPDSQMLARKADNRCEGVVSRIGKGIEPKRDVYQKTYYETCKLAKVCKIRRIKTNIKLT